MSAHEMSRPKGTSPPARSGTWRLGRLAGVGIDVHWSWAIAFALVSTSLAASVFPAAAPGLGAGAYLAMGMLSAVALFGSIVLHELGHAWQARREGVATDRVTLWVFGGIAEMRRRFPSAGSEFRIAVAGPLVTLALAAGFVALSTVIALPAAAAAVIAWLGYVNVVLLGFNLLPALPLDGGRVLRSALWARRRDFLGATMIATGVGRAVAVAMIVLGLLVGVIAGISGLWLALVGWFILGAGSAERRSAIAAGQRRG